MGQQQGAYFVPTKSSWPFIAAVVMFVTVFGASHWLSAQPSDTSFGKTVLVIGILGVLGMFFGWFRSVIRESLAGNYNSQVDRSFRMGMLWFIFSEVMFFGAFFGALFYARMFAVPWLGGEGHGVLTNQFLYPSYTGGWGAAGGNGPARIGGSFETVAAWGLPLLNTLILLTSSVTVTIAHHALKSAHRGRVLVFLGLTVLLGATFLYCQAHEYMEAYKELNLTLHSGVYGSTFFMLTGFHGMHVTLGTIMLAVIWFRVLKGHFNKEHHFGFEAVAWYWHFVDVVWLGLFMFVYIL
jgi:cytochrome c oxidase subunit 3